jgi:Flp pilus assembly protein TadG
MKFKSEKGVVAIEMAILLPLLILFLFGSIEFGLLTYNKQIITNASREGARAGIVIQDTKLSANDIIGIVEDYAENHLVSFGANNTLTILVTNAGASFPADLGVQVSYAYDFLVLANLGFGPVTIEAETVMRME